MQSKTRHTIGETKAKKKVQSRSLMALSAPPTSDGKIVEQETEPLYQHLCWSLGSAYLSLPATASPSHFASPAPADPTESAELEWPLSPARAVWSTTEDVRAVGEGFAEGVSDDSLSRLLGLLGSMSQEDAGRGRKRSRPREWLGVYNACVS